MYWCSKTEFRKNDTQPQAACQTFRMMWLAIVSSSVCNQHCFFLATVVPWTSQFGVAIGSLPGKKHAPRGGRGYRWHRGMAYMQRCLLLVPQHTALENGISLVGRLGAPLRNSQVSRNNLWTDHRGTSHDCSYAHLKRWCKWDPSFRM